MKIKIKNESAVGPGEVLPFLIFHLILIRDWT